MPRKKKMVLLTGNCSHLGCMNRSVLAEKITSDLWIERCKDHFAIKITIDIKKIGIYVDPDLIVTRPVA